MQLTDEEKQLYGLSCDNLVSFSHRQRTFLLHEAALQAFRRLQADASAAGFDLQPVSSWRSFDRQMAIWNGKARGERPLLDVEGRPLDHAMLDDQQRLAAILRWSAVPGLSRHHWGCDLDIYDASAMAAEDVQLTPAEVSGNGPCAPLHEWLDERIAADKSCGFFRPYSNHACKVAEEKWHLSYLPLAARYQALLDADKLVHVWQQKQLLLLPQLLDDYRSIFRDYACLNADRLPGWVASRLA